MSLDLVLTPLKEPAAPGLPAEPRQARLYRLLKQAILDGRLVPGASLPSSRQLAADFRLARNSVLFAYQQLVAEGFLDADRGGTRIAALPLATGRRRRAVAPSVPGALARRAHQLPAMSAGEAPLPFALGVPDLNAFPWATWAKFLQQAWGEVSARQLAYAEPGGEPELRRAVASFLSARRGVACTPEQVFIVAGSQVALDACARLLADSGETVWLENPGYLAARNSMLAAGLNPVYVPVDGHGMAPPADLWERAPPRLIYLTPSHQYPLGSVLSLERRLHFLQRLRPGTHWLIEDDYDSDYNHAGPHSGRPYGPPSRPLPAIQGLQPEAPVIYIGTFSKLLYPGLRIAYMVVPRWATAQIGQAIGTLYRGGQAVEQRALARFMESGKLVRHLRTMAPVYRERRDILRAELQRYFGAEGEILGGQAGQHLVLRLPDGPPDEQIARAARERGVTVRPLSGYFAGETRENGLVLGYGIAEAGRIPELVARVRRAWEAVRSGDGACTE